MFDIPAMGAMGVLFNNPHIRQLLAQQGTTQPQAPQGPPSWYSNGNRQASWDELFPQLNTTTAAPATGQPAIGQGGGWQDVITRIVQAQGGASPTAVAGQQGGGLAQLIAMMMQGQGGQPGFANMLTQRGGQSPVGGGNQLMSAQRPMQRPMFSGIWQ